MNETMQFNLTDVVNNFALIKSQIDLELQRLREIVALDKVAPTLAKFHDNLVIPIVNEYIYHNKVEDWTEHTEETFSHLIEKSDSTVSNMIGCLVALLGRNQVTAYLVMMTIRLTELHRVLKPTGSLYLHCDPTSSHYLKLVLDAIFGVKNFRNEIIWHYRRWTGNAKHFLKMHDTILFYTKTNRYTFNPQYTSYTEKSLKRKQHFHTRIKGDDVYETTVNDKGVLDNDVWTIPVLNSQAKERLSYPTQKPLELIKKIIVSSSSEVDLVLDPFCGCGTTIEAAELLNRRWVGIDITHIAISLIKYRLNQ